ncbi:MAG TPA: spondin domain-containing protein [Kofleriaceae bacterium]|nr:spondin domain-containing protein [Kofleriaceae bacterium]
MNLRASCLCALALAACADKANDPFTDVDGDGVDDNDPDALHPFTLRFENVAPYTVLKASVAYTQPGQTVGSNLAPGQFYEIRFTAGNNQNLSLATMLYESNDWFFGTDPAGIPLYTNGVPLSGDITSMLKLYDAGTEADEEPGVGSTTGVNQGTMSALGSKDPNNLVRVLGDVVTLTNGAQFARPAIASMIKVTVTPGTQRDFLVRVQNVSTTDTLVTSAGNRAITLTSTLWAVHCSPGIFFEEGKPVRANGFESLAEAGNAWTISDALRLERGIATPFSKGVYAIHQDGNPMFIENSVDYRFGLEKVAEDGDPSALVASYGQGLVGEVESYGAFEAAEGPCHAGKSFEFQFKARQGDRLSLASGFMASNDWFLATPSEGMELFSGSLPRWGEITTELRLFDLGTESDEELDIGSHVGTQQTSANSGNPDGNKNVRAIGRDKYDVPLTQHVRVTLVPPTK